VSIERRGLLSRLEKLHEARTQRRDGGRPVADPVLGGGIDLRKAGPEHLHVEERIVAESSGTSRRLQDLAIYGTPDDLLAAVREHQCDRADVMGGAPPDRHVLQRLEQPLVVRLIEIGRSEIGSAGEALGTHAWSPVQSVHAEPRVVREHRIGRSGGEVPSLGERVVFKGLECLDLILFRRPGYARLFQFDQPDAGNRPHQLADLPELVCAPGRDDQGVHRSVATLKREEAVDPDGGERHHFGELRGRKGTSLSGTLHFHESPALQRNHVQVDFRDGILRIIQIQ
jgi:hypothetical protein